MMKKTNAVTPYRIPIFLWSTVVNQPHTPVVAVGRAKSPLRARGSGHRHQQSLPRAPLSSVETHQVGDQLRRSLARESP